MYIFFLILFGQGLKLGPINFIDEVGLFIGVLKRNKFSKFKLKFKVKYNFIFYFGVYFFLIHIVGYVFFHQINAIRLSVLGLMLALASSSKINFFSKSAITASWLYPIVIILVCVYEITNGLRTSTRMWHQEWFWSGSAYSALGLVVSSIIVTIYHNKSYVLVFLNIFISVVAAIITDSRTTFGLILGLLFIIILELVFNAFKSPKKLLYGASISIIITLGLIYFYELYYDAVYAVIDTLNAIFGDGHRKSDEDRFNQFAVISAYINDTNLFNLIFGYGGESYKQILVRYMGADAHALRRIVRPTGFPAFIVMGGFLFTLALYVKIVYNIIMPFKSLKFSAKTIFVYLKISYLHCALFIFPFITNVMDSVLYFSLILFANEFQKTSKSLTV